MTRVFVGLGSNLGDRVKHLATAMEELKRAPSVRFRRMSSIYETEPVGVKDQPYFLNLVAELEVDGEPDDFLRVVKDIEHRTGRTERERWGPREIDIDILYFGRTVLLDGDVRVPHPEIAHRRFVLVPLKELEPDFPDPLRKMSVSDLLRACQDAGTVRKTSLTLE